jgi:hypothetical protein
LTRTPLRAAEEKRRRRKGRRKGGKKRRRRKPRGCYCPPLLPFHTSDQRPAREGGRERASAGGRGRLD